MKSWWRTDEKLMKNWRRDDKELLKEWWRTDEEMVLSGLLPRTFYFTGKLSPDGLPGLDISLTEPTRAPPAVLIMACWQFWFGNKSNTTWYYTLTCCCKKYVPGRRSSPWMGPLTLLSLLSLSSCSWSTWSLTVSFVMHGPQNVRNHIMIKDCFLDHSIPVLWALLTRKTTKAYYDGVFEPLRRMMEERVAGAAYFENKAVVVDFELAISAALRAAFPNFR